MSAHTPGSWEVAGPWPRVSVGVPDHSQDDASVGWFGFTPICFMAEDVTTDDVCDHANAAFIVRACNAHDALLNALEDALEFVADREDVVDGDYGTPAPNRAMQLAAVLRAAIAKATGVAP